MLTQWMALSELNEWISLMINLKKKTKKKRIKLIIHVFFFFFLIKIALHLLQYLITIPIHMYIKSVSKPYYHMVS